MKTKVSDLIARFLREKGIRYVFGIVGAGNAHIFDSITAHGYTQIVCVHHEQTATMAMQSYYRTNGVVTGALLTTGGGSSNGVTGVVSAWMDSVPSLVISGNENSKFTRDENPLRIYGVQGFDSPGMMRKVTKYSVRVMEPESILYELEKAHFIASCGRPGPCWIDVPMNVQSAIIDESKLVQFETEREAAALRPPVATAAEREAFLKCIRDRFASAKRPLMWFGQGIRLAGATDKLPSLLECVRVPSLVSWTGIDMIDSDHPLVYGRAGTYGQRAANLILQNCDFLLTIGTRLAIPQVGYDISEFARDAKIAVVDIDRRELDKYRERFTHILCADSSEFLIDLLAGCAKQPVSAPIEWIKQCDDYRHRYPWVGPEHADYGGFINSYQFMDRLVRHFKADQVVVTDMGTALLSGHQVLRLKPPQRLMTSLGLGEMGWGLPGAIGASFARNRGEVLCLNCDGGMMMNLQELQTIAHHKLPIKIVVFNNDGYLMIKHTQKTLFQGRYSGTDARSGVSCPNFSALASVFGFPSYCIRTWADFDDAIPKLQAEPGPAICDVFMHPEQLFVPKLSLASQADGTLVSPPLEDLSPLLPRDELRRNMMIGLHPKSENLMP